MSYGINLGVTQDNYPVGPGDTSNPNIITCPECWRVDIYVYDNPLAYQLQAATDSGQTGDSGLWYPERVIPADDTILVAISIDRRCTGFKARSVNAGKPAVYVVELIPPSELPPTGFTAPGSTRHGGKYPGPNLPGR